MVREDAAPDVDYHQQDGRAFEVTRDAAAVKNIELGKRWVSEDPSTDGMPHLVAEDSECVEYPGRPEKGQANQSDERGDEEHDPGGPVQVSNLGYRFG